MKLIRVIQSKIVKKDNKYQVQSEKGKNLGTYDTKSEAEKRLKQVEMFKHMKSNDDQYSEFLRKLEKSETLDGVDHEVYIDKMSYGELKLVLRALNYDDESEDISFTVDLDMDLEDFQEGYASTYWEPGESSYYETYKLNKITISEIDGKKVNINIPLDSNFGKWIYNNTEEEYTTNEDYFPAPEDSYDYYKEKQLEKLSKK